MMEYKIYPVPDDAYDFVLNEDSIDFLSNYEEEIPHSIPLSCAKYYHEILAEVTIDSIKSRGVYKNYRFRKYHQIFNSGDKSLYYLLDEISVKGEKGKLLIIGVL